MHGFHETGGRGPVPVIVEYDAAGAHEFGFCQVRLDVFGVPVECYVQQAVPVESVYKYFQLTS